jgi:hypothetical protein
MSHPLAQRGRGMQSGQSLHSAIFGNFEPEFGKKATLGGDYLNYLLVSTSACYLLSVYLQLPLIR